MSKTDRELGKVMIGYEMLSSLITLPEEVVLIDIDINRQRRLVSFIYEAEEKNRWTRPTKECQEVHTHTISTDDLYKQMKKFVTQYEADHNPNNVSADKSVNESAADTFKRLSGLDLKEGTVAHELLNIIDQMFKGGFDSDQGSEKR